MRLRLVSIASDARLDRVAVAPVLKELESMKHVSIIIPVLDEEKILESSLNSLQILRKNNCEIIVVDGGSSDRS